MKYCPEEPYGLLFLINEYIYGYHNVKQKTNANKIVNNI